MGIRTLIAAAVMVLVLPADANVSCALSDEEWLELTLEQRAIQSFSPH